MYERAFEGGVGVGERGNLLRVESANDGFLTGLSEYDEFIALVHNARI